MTHCSETYIGQNSLRQLIKCRFVTNSVENLVVRLNQPIFHPFWFVSSLILAASPYTYFAMARTSSDATETFPVVQM